MPSLAENRYGKTRVRLAKVNRGGPGHSIREWTIDIFLSGDFQQAFTEGDNSHVLPTDTMKNTVYSLARSSSAGSMEEFGIELTEHFLQASSRANDVRIEIAEKSWTNISAGGKLHAYSFEERGREMQTASVSGARGREPVVAAGMKQLTILKSAGSEFSGFLKDALTTLPETRDRLLATEMTANWEYDARPSSFDKARYQVRSALLGCFAEHHSLSVQHTLYAMAESALAACPEMTQITLVMPNKHYLLFDLTRFEQDNPNEIFVPTDEPSGYIEATIRRS